MMVLLMGSGLFFPWIVPFRELEKFLSEHRLGGTAVRPSAGTALESWAFGVVSQRGQTQTLCSDSLRGSISELGEVSLK